MPDPSTLTDAERDALLEDGIELAYANMHSEWAQAQVFGIVAKIKADAVAQALLPVQDLADEWVASTRGIEEPDDWYGSKLCAALAADPAEWLTERVDEALAEVEKRMRDQGLTRFGVESATLNLVRALREERRHG